MSREIKIHFAHNQGDIICGRLAGHVTDKLEEVTCSSCKNRIHVYKSDKRKIPNKKQIPF